jgi:antitoxin component of MazEF toxin-antitoxin module
MAKELKLRRIGNSVGLTISKETLSRAGFDNDEKIALFVAPGEIRLRSASDRHRLDLSQSEIKALVGGDLDGKDGKALIAKAKSLLKDKK